MKFEHTEVWGFEHAIRGMRNPHNSWDKSDSYTRDTGWDMCSWGGVKIYFDEDKEIKFFIGENDLHLMQSLIKAGSEHRKFLRQIFVSVDITAPLYWWKHFDAYKVGTVANSCSTMHKLASTPITFDCFEMDDFEKHLDLFYIRGREDLIRYWENLIEHLEGLRCFYNETKDKRYWKELIRLLPESWLQTRTVTMNYENILNMYNQRCVHSHKLTEWSVTFKEWVKSLPYAQELFEELKDGRL